MVVQRSLPGEGVCLPTFHAYPSIMLMHRLIPPWLLLSLLPVIAHAQVSTDSLSAVLDELPAGQPRLDQLAIWRQNYAMADLDDAPAFYRRYVAEAVTAGDRNAEAKATLDLSAALYAVHEHVLADSLVVALAGRAERVSDLGTRFNLLMSATRATPYQGKFDLGLTLDSAAIETARLLPAEQRPDSLINYAKAIRAELLAGKGNFVEAALIHREVIEFTRENLRDTGLLIDQYTQLGTTYGKIGLYDEAEATFQLPLELYPDYIDNVVLGQTYYNLGLTGLQTGKYEAAIDNFRRMLSIDFIPGQKEYFHTYAYAGLLESYYQLDDFNGLNGTYQAYDDFLDQNPGPGARDNPFYRRSTAIWQLNNGNYRQAITTLEQLLRSARRRREPTEIILYAGLLADAHRKLGDYQRVDAYTTERSAVRDSVQSANRNEALLLFYNQFETEEKENEILRLDAERQRESFRRTLFQTAAGLLGVLLLAGTYFFVRLRRARRQLADQNEDLNKLNATKDRFFSIIAHDLRNPIVALQRADRQVDYLYDRGQTEEVKGVVGAISATARQLSGLLDNLLQWALSQGNAIELEPTNIPLAEIIDETLKLYAPAAATKNVVLTHDVAPDTQAFADANAVRTILRNLIGNAVKFSYGDRPGKVAVSYTRVGTEQRLSVADDGPGLAPEVKNQLFTLHRQSGDSGRRRAGTGLGLILVRELAELHGGRVEVESEVGAGTRVEVVLPGSR